jgi:hypothetical protein
MSRLVLFAIGMTMAMVIPPKADARVVDYLMDQRAIEAAALDQGIEGPFTEAPSRNSVQIALETPSAADHKVTVVSIYCQAYKIENPASVLIQNLLLGADRDGKLHDRGDDQVDLTVRLIKASTLLRCMAPNDLTTLCRNGVKITAEARIKKADGSVIQVPLTANVERAGRVGGFCGNIARYTGIVTREAGIALVNQALAAYVESRRPVQ